MSARSIHLCQTPPAAASSRVETAAPGRGDKPRNASSDTPRAYWKPLGAGSGRDGTVVRREVAGSAPAVSQSVPVRSAASATPIAPMPGLMSIASHEIRSPLIAILGFSELLGLSESLPDEEREHVERIRDAGNHLLRVVSDILDLDRAERGRMEIRPETMRLADLLGPSLEAGRMQAEGRGLAFGAMTHASADVRLDPVRVRQVMDNLLSNAVKFTDAGSVFVEARLVDDTLSVVIEDTGRGVAADELDCIFEPFARSRSASGVQGAGLGMPLVKSLVESMGGTIRFESEWGAGSRVTLAWPGVMPAPVETPEG